MSDFSKPNNYMKGKFMKIFKPGSQLYRLICLISVCGEFPVNSLHLLGNKRLYRRVVSECTIPVTIQNFETKETLFLPKIFNLAQFNANIKLKLNPFNPLTFGLKWVKMGIVKY